MWLLILLKQRFEKNTNTCKTRLDALEEEGEWVIGLLDPSKKALQSECSGYIYSDRLLMSFQVT